MKCKKHPTYTGENPPKVVVNCRKCNLIYCKKYWKKKSPAEIATAIGKSVITLKTYYLELGLPFSLKQDFASPEDKVDIDIVEKKFKDKLKESNKRDKVFIDKIHDLEKKLEVCTLLKNVQPTYTLRKNGSLKNEAVAFAIASDWHIEEMVNYGHTNGFNQFNERVCRERIDRFFRHTVKLLNKESSFTKIDTLFLCLLGDFITGNIHDDLIMNCRLQPMEAAKEAQQYLMTGIEYLLKHTSVKIIIPCLAGNHSRITKKQMISSEVGNAIETLMYFMLAKRYENEPRIEFILQSGYHTIIDVYGFKIRLHHGHQLKYGGGVGGLTIPTNKAIAQWNKSYPVYLDIFGHWHTSLNFPTFVSNGSLIGYSAYAVSIKAEPEVAKQQFFLIDKEDGKTGLFPIILTHDK